MCHRGLYEDVRIIILLFFSLVYLSSAYVFFLLYLVKYDTGRVEEEAVDCFCHVLYEWHEIIRADLDSYAWSVESSLQVYQ